MAETTKQANKTPTNNHTLNFLSNKFILVILQVSLVKISEMVERGGGKECELLSVGDSMSRLEEVLDNEEFPFSFEIIQLIL
jgi:hypothetical protein